MRDLVELGPMPTDDGARAQPDRVKRWEDVLEGLDAAGAVSDAEAISLLPLFPRDDSDCFEMAWTLVHLVESAASWPLQEALSSVTGPWADVLRRRTAGPPRPARIKSHEM